MRNETAKHHPVAAIRSKAQREGISLKPVNRSPYNRRSKAAKRR
ncbi:hypothetical protein ABIB85_000561 [Bradyrhizobium sp. JR1.5]